MMMHIGNGIQDLQKMILLIMENILLLIVKHLNFMVMVQHRIRIFYIKNMNMLVKKVSFILDETKASYHTLDGAGFILNASRSNNELSGYILLFQETKICLYRLDNVNLEEFETTADRTVESYAGEPIASVDKTSATIHNLVMKASPTNITVSDNGTEILNVNLDYSKHVGEDFGLISSYTEHGCPILSEIWFIRTELEINNYSFPVIKSDMNGKVLKGAKFEVKMRKER